MTACHTFFQEARELLCDSKGIRYSDRMLKDWLAEGGVFLGLEIMPLDWLSDVNKLILREWLLYRAACLDCDSQKMMVHLKAIELVMERRGIGR